MSSNRYISYNRQLFPEDQPVVNPSNRAFRYGDGLFETIRLVNGKPVFLEQHLRRMEKGMNLLRMELPGWLSLDFFSQEIGRLAQKNGIVASGRIRISVFRNEGGLFAPEQNSVSYLMEAVPLRNNGYVLNKEGFTIGIYKDHQIVGNDYSAIKSINCIPYILAGIYKKENQLDDCILLNEHGGIAEAISSNLFLVFNGVLYTPSLSEGCVEGVMRAQIIKIALQHKIEIQECPLMPNVLMKADEVFLTNVVVGINWAGAYGQKRYFNKMSGFLLEKLNDSIVNLKLDLQGN